MLHSRKLPATEGLFRGFEGLLFYDWDFQRDELQWSAHARTEWRTLAIDLPRDRQSWLRAVHPDDRPSVERLLNCFRTERAPIRLEYRLEDAQAEHPVLIERASFLGSDRVIGCVHCPGPMQFLDPQFDRLLASAQLGLLLIDAQGRVQSAHPGVAAFFGYDPPELLGLPIERLIPEFAVNHSAPTDHDQLSILNGGSLAGREYRGLGKDGRVLELALALHPCLDAAALRVACVIMDLAPLKQSERDLVRFFDLTLDLFCIAGLDGFFLRINRNFERLLGHSETEFLARPFLEFVHPDDREPTLQVMERLADDEPVFQFRNRYRARSGAYLWLEWNARAVLAEGRIYAVARDVSQRVRMEQEILAREERERAILENSQAVVYVKGRDGRYQFINRRYLELFRLQREDVIGKSDAEIFPPEVAREFERNDRLVRDSLQTVSTEESVPHSEGPHTFVSVKFPLYDGERQLSAIAGISTDITDQIRARSAEYQLELARVFQQKLLPIHPPRMQGLEIAGKAIPVAQLCGDYFDFIPLGPNRLVVSVGDVSGHGYGSALHMVELRASLRLLLRNPNPLYEILEDLNHLLCEDLPDSSFITLFLAAIDCERRELHYVGAGHGALLIRTDGSLIHLPSTGLVAGIDPQTRYLPAPAIPLEPGDALLVITDGLIESTNRDGQAFGEERLRALASTHAHASARVLLHELFHAVHQFVGDQPILDDTTAVVVKLVE